MRLPGSATRLGLLPVLLLSLGGVLVSAGRAGTYGQLGLALKTGESAGAFGTQVAYNFDPHWQAAVGVGGASIPFFLEYGNERTDSYFLMGKYYLQHLYLGTGYSYKRSRVERVVENQVYSDAATAHGVPLHLGYEFGNRKGFFFSSSIGALFVFKGGDRELSAGVAEKTSRATTAATGTSMSLSLGYYFDLQR